MDDKLNCTGEGPSCLISGSDHDLLINMQTAGGRTNSYLTSLTSRSQDMFKEVISIAQQISDSPCPHVSVSGVQYTHALRQRSISPNNHDKRYYCLDGNNRKQRTSVRGTCVYT
jgi:hypothetical protein